MLRDVDGKCEKYCHDQGPPSEKWFPKVSLLLTFIFEGFTFICPKICQDVLFGQDHILIF